MEALHSRLSPFVWRAGLHALAQLGAVEALPLVDRSVEERYEDESNFAQAARARLIAEASGSEIPAAEGHAGVKVRAFFRELDRTHTTLNADLYAFRHPAAALNERGQRFFISTTGPTTQPVAIYALRQLADMVYHGEFARYAVLPDVVLTHFREDYGSALKMRLAPLSRPERLQTLVEELAHRQVLRGETRYDMQLAANEGEEAGRLIAAKLEQMEANREGYSGAGFTALFRVLGGLGDARYEPVVRRFFQKPGKINCNNLGYYNVRDGIAVTLVSAY